MERLVGRVAEGGASEQKVVRERRRSVTGLLIRQAVDQPTQRRQRPAELDDIASALLDEALDAVELDAPDGRVEIACDGRSYELPIDDIVRANLVPNWEREFRHGQSHDHPGGTGPTKGLDQKRSIS